MKNAHTDRGRNDLRKGRGKARLAWRALAMALFLLLGLAASPAQAAPAPTPAEPTGVPKEMTCDPNDADSFQRKLLQSTAAYVDYGIMAGRTVYAQQPITHNMTCLTTVLKYFQTIHDLLSGIKSIMGAIVAAVLRIITDLINQVCEYAAGIINYGLSKICLPLPDFNFGLNNWDLKYPGAESCNGISGTDLLRVNPSPLFVVHDPFPAVLNNMSRGLVDPSGNSRF